MKEMESPFAQNRVLVLNLILEVHRAGDFPTVDDPSAYFDPGDGVGHIGKSGVGNDAEFYRAIPCPSSGAVTPNILLIDP